MSSARFMEEHARFASVDDVNTSGQPPRRWSHAGNVQGGAGEEHSNDTSLMLVGDEDAAPPTLRRAVLTTLPFFMGYSGMVILQHHVKRRMGIEDGGPRSQAFASAVGTLYVCNLLLRLLHNVVFTALPPRRRVQLAYALMAGAQLALGGAYWLLDSRSLAWIFAAYGLAGVAIGTFEANLMSTITPLGHGTKAWAVAGIPVGFTLVNVGVFALLSVWPGSQLIEGGVYFFIAAANVLGLAFFTFAIPAVAFDASRDDARKFWADMTQWRAWLPALWRHCLALAVAMFGVSLFGVVALNVYDGAALPLYPGAAATVPKNVFMAAFNLLGFAGDFSARRLAYWVRRPHNPLYYVGLTAVGAAIVLSKTAVAAPASMFCVMFCNGSVYAHTTRFVDDAVARRFNLVALSAWLFCGDIGSVVAAQLAAVVTKAVGPV
jgi:hypothetical protein